MFNMDKSQVPSLRISTKRINVIEHMGIQAVDSIPDKDNSVAGNIHDDSQTYM